MIKPRSRSLPDLLRITTRAGQPAILEFPTPEEARSEYDRISSLLGE